MARIKVNSQCNVCTQEHSQAYVRYDGTCDPQITVPQLRLRLGVEEAKALAEALLEAVAVAQANGGAL